MKQIARLCDLQRERSAAGLKSAVDHVRVLARDYEQSCEILRAAEQAWALTVETQEPGSAITASWAASLLRQSASNDEQALTLAGAQDVQAQREKEKMIADARSDVSSEMLNKTKRYACRESEERQLEAKSNYPVNQGSKQ